MKILDKEIKLNDVVTIGYLNKNNYWLISTGRVYNWDDKYLYLDISDELVTLDETIRIQKNKIKYLTITMNTNLWR